MPDEEALSKKLTIVLGLPCSGKSRLVEQKYGSRPFVWIAIDRIARRLPEYSAVRAVKCYEESADIAALILVKAVQQSAPLIVVETVGRRQEELLRLALSIKRCGYGAELLWIRQPLVKSAERAIERFRSEGGPFIDPAYVIEDLRRSPGHALIGTGVFDRWSIWDVSRNPAGELVFNRKGGAPPDSPSSYRRGGGIDWAMAWETTLAKASEKIAAQISMSS